MGGRWEWNARNPTPGAIQLGEYKLGQAVSSGSSVQIAAAGLPQNYRHLRIQGDVQISASTKLTLQLNGDQAGNYAWGILTKNAVTWSQLTGNVIELNRPPLGPAFCSFTIDLPNYSAIKATQIIRTSLTSDNATVEAFSTDGIWTPATPVTSFRVFVAGAHFVDGSTMDWYGIP